jgi:hypothetical protein
MSLEQGRTENPVLHAAVDKIAVGVSMHLWMHFDIGDFVFGGASFGTFAVREVAGSSGVIFPTFTAKFGTHLLAPRAHHRDINKAYTSSLKFCRPIRVDGRGGQAA